MPRLFLPVLYSILLFAPGSGLAAWRVPEAPIRFELSVRHAPTHEAAGYFVEIPDGGLLPGPNPVPRVFTADGAPVESYTLWHNPATRMALVFAEHSQASDYHVYVSGATRYRLWTPETDLAPSVIKTTDPSRAGVNVARGLRNMGRVDAAVHHINHPGVPRARLSVGWDPTGRPKPASFYLLAHVVSADPGRFWISPGTIEGEGEVYINGQRLGSRRRSNKPGGVGDWAEIKPGPNRVEVFHSAPGTEAFRSGMMWLAWRPPNATVHELGGPGADGAPQLEARLIENHEIMRSGKCVIQTARSRDGAPVALLRHGDAKVFWFENETPLLVYQFNSISENHPEGTQVVWAPASGVTVEDPSLWWIYPGFTEQRLELTVTGPAGRTRTAYPFYTFSSRATSLNSVADRRDYRRALWDMLRAYPPRHAAVDRWDPAVWRNLLRTVEPGRGYPLFVDLFERHGDVLRAKISRGEWESLQDMFLDTAPRFDAPDALAWIERFRRAAPDGRRRDELTVREAEIHMHYLDDLDTAHDMLVAFARREDDIGQAARLRLGDLALMEGDLNLATQYYADAQVRARRMRSATVTGGEGDRTAAGRMEALLRQMGRTVVGAGMDPNQAQDWRTRVMLDVAASETVRSLLEQQYLPEAREALRLWELTAPISRISADQLLLEARFWRTVGDARRAMNLLRAFCDTVEASAFLPQAAPLLIHMMREVELPDEVVRDYAETLKKRLEFHPVKDEIDRILSPEMEVERVTVEMDEWYRKWVSPDARRAPRPSREAVIENETP